MNNQRLLRMPLALFVILVISISLAGSIVPFKKKPTPTTPATITKITATWTPTRTVTSTFTPTSTNTVTPPVTITELSPTFTSTATYTPTSTPSGEPVDPYLSAPLCSHPSNSGFHTLWDSIQGCHYDHEHGQDPFTAQVTSAFPGFDLFSLLGNVEIGHTNPSSPMENTMKHGGFKWQVDITAPQGCATGFEGGSVAVDAYAIQYHAFGPQSIEFEARNHSSAALLRQCKPGNPSDKGYIYVVQLQEYGQRVSPYQGVVLAYPDNFQPTYEGQFGPYLTTDCIGVGLGGCRTDLAFITGRNLNTNSIWTSKPTGLAGSPRPETSRLFRLLFRLRDTYQVLNSADLVYPFTWPFVCGNTAYDPAGCRYNNSTTTIHEIAGDIPAVWDGLAGFDTDPRAGRVTAEGFVTRFGILNLECVEAGADCHPIKMVSAFVGRYSSEISAVKVSNPTPLDTPERDIYFCSGVLCSETTPFSSPSGWIGEGN